MANCHLTGNFVIADEARETRANYLKLRNTGDKTKTSNKAIQEAAYQVSLAKQAVLHEEAKICEHLKNLSPQVQPPWKRKLYFPVIVITARLFVCEFDSRAVNPATGEINTTDAALSECGSIVFEFTLPRHLQMAPLNLGNAYNEGLVDIVTRLHVPHVINMVPHVQLGRWLRTLTDRSSRPLRQR